MMSENIGILIEVFLVFGLALGFSIWQLRSVNRAIREREARKLAEAERRDDDAKTG